MLKQEQYANMEAQTAQKYAPNRSLEMYGVTAYRIKQGLGLTHLCTPARAVFMSSYPKLNTWKGPHALIFYCHGLEILNFIFQLIFSKWSLWDNGTHVSRYTQYTRSQFHAAPFVYNNHNAPCAGGPAMGVGSASFKACNLYDWVSRSGNSPARPCFKILIRVLHTERWQ